MYDAAYNHTLALSKEFEASVALEAKRRAGDHGVMPSWLRPSVGLQYTLPHKEKALITLTRQNPDLKRAGFGVDYEASLSGKLGNFLVPGSPDYMLRARIADWKPSYQATLIFDGDRLFKGHIDLGAQAGTASISGAGGVSMKRPWKHGLDFVSDINLVAVPTGTPGETKVNLQPGLSAYVDAASFLPNVVEAGSKAGMTARYMPGSAPMLSSFASLRFKPIGPLTVGMITSRDGAGNFNGLLKATGRAAGASVHYEAMLSKGRPPQQFGEVIYPATAQGGTARFYGRLTQSPDDFGGKPRMQVGLQYDVQLGGASLSGEGPVYDAGKGAASLIEADGKGWHNPRPGSARKVAAELRKRISSSEGSARPWLSA